MSAQGRKQPMLRHAHFGTKGGKLPFAASWLKVCLGEIDVDPRAMLKRGSQKTPTGEMPC